MPMFSEIYIIDKVYHNGHLDKAMEQQKIIENNNLIFMKKKELINGEEKEMIYNRSKDFRKTRKRVHFSPTNQTYSILDKTRNSDIQGMPNLPIDSLILYKKKKSGVHSKKNRKGSQKNKKAIQKEKRRK
jgi:hypothetical protein